MHYEAGRLPEAVTDLDTALALAPDLAELYRNRAVALSALGRSDHAIRDLTTYLELCDDADDRETAGAALTELLAAR